MVLDLKNNNYAMAQANVYRIYFLYLLKGAFLELCYFIKHEVMQCFLLSSTWSKIEFVLRKHLCYVPK